MARTRSRPWRPHIDESIAELGRALDELGMAGVVMNTTILGQALAEPRFEPIFAELNRRGAVLYLHPAGNSACTPLIKDFSLTWMVGAPVEDTISTMQLITRGIPSRYPDVKIINSHRLVLGTDFPYETGDIFVRAVDYIFAAGLPAGQAEAILERNAMELLGISR